VVKQMSDAEYSGSMAAPTKHHSRSSRGDARCDKSAGKSSELSLPGHSCWFNADYRPSYRPQAAKDGWARMLAWFKKNGVA